MKQGVYKGYNAGCCNGLEIWGVSANMPNFHAGDPDGFISSNIISYNLRDHEIEPEIHPRARNHGWELFAAQVPGTYPPPAGTLRPSSSKADGTWEVSLGASGYHFYVEVESVGYDSIDDISYVKGSRAIYLDGQQAFVTYRVSTKFPPYTISNHDTHGSDLGDHYVINIAAQSADLYRVGSLNLKVNDVGSSLSSMETEFATKVNVVGWQSNVLATDGTVNEVHTQVPCNVMSCGREYYIISTYRPGGTNWSVGRVKYEGTRPTNGSGGTEAGLEIFCTQIDSGTERVGDPEGSYTGDYWIVMPSCRVYIDTSVEGVDEAWVCAIHKDDEEDEYIVTGRWQSKVWAGTSDSWTGFADGTLHSSEVENIILDKNDSELTSRYPEESWANVQIRSYNRVYDPTTGHSRDLLIFTTQDTDSFQETDADIVADFEGGDINSGLEDAGIEFTTGGQADTSGWISSATSPDTGSYSARTDPVNVYLDQTLFLRITFSKVDPGYITFNYRHHNRIWGEPGAGIGDQLFNFPVPDNYLDIRLDGNVIDGDTRIDEDNPLAVGNALIEVDNGSGWALIESSRMDNLSSPADCTGDEDKFLAWRPVRIWVEAGTHTLSFNQRRAENSNGDTLTHLYSQVDELNLGVLMVGEDTTGKKRWFYNGEKVQKAEWWVWPYRDDEGKITLDQRFSTTPDFITLDKQGRILYGNPHYIVRLIPNEDDPGYWKLDTSFGQPRGHGYDEDPGEGGYLKFTASDATKITGASNLAPTCDNPDNVFDVLDTLADPPWGAFQILPMGSAGDFQVRGANSSMRDASNEPFLRGDFPINTDPERNEYFIERLYVTPLVGSKFYWGERLHSWTITDNGTSKRPHVEIVWRPFRYGMSYPPGPYSSPPYASNFQSSDYDDPFGPANMRPRDKFKLMSGSTRPRWSSSSYIVPATYSDMLSHDPQAVWAWSTADPEVGVDDWDPNFAPGPWPTAKKQLVQAQFSPTGRIGITYTGPNESADFDAVCESEEGDDPIVFFKIRIGVRIAATDFDAVDVQCTCCD